MTRWAIERTRSHDRLLAENKRYGYQRNLLALRPYGLTMAAVFGIAAIITIFTVAAATVLLQTLVVGIAISLFAFWHVIPDEKRVRVADDRYAKALFDAATEGV